jgi:hypothetical protein
LQLRLELKEDDKGFGNPIAKFVCETVVEMLALAAMRYAPKLPGFEAIGEMEDFALESICGD